MSLIPAVFLDRDGVLIEDVNLLTRPDQVRILENVPLALGRLGKAGFKLIVVSNQSVVARGWSSEKDVVSLQREVEREIARGGGPALDGFYFCPHHPKATLPAYRMDCECRKPRPGLLRVAAQEHGLDLGKSFMIGDRITDVIAGTSAGCRTVQVQTGRHDDPPICTREPLDGAVRPEYTCADLLAAAKWILNVR